MVMVVSLNTGNNLYAYDGSVANLLGLDVLPVFSGQTSGIITDGDGILTQDDDTTVSLGGGPEQPLNYIGSSAVIGAINSTPMIIFSTGSGDTEQLWVYLPQGLPFLGGVLASYAPLSTEPLNLFANAPGVVDGTADGQTMGVGFTDADGDRITNGADTILGNGGNDGIGAGGGDDLVFGGTGNDTVNAGDGNDTVYGEDGADSIVGGAGADLIDGGVGDDVIGGDAGADLIYGGAGNDSLYGNADDDTIYGGIGNDILFGQGGNNTLFGEEGNDTLAGGNGFADLIEGGIGDDLVIATSGADTVDGGEGTDTLQAYIGVETLANNMNVTVDENGNGSATINGVNGGTFTSFENFVAAEVAGQNDTITFSTATGFDSITGIAPGASGVFTSDEGTIVPFGGAGQPTYGELVVAIQSGTYGRGTISITGGDEAGQVGGITFSNFETINISVTCFTRDAMIMTDNGEVRIEDLTEGDYVQTVDNGLQQIKWIGSQKLSAADLGANPKLKPIRIAAGALGCGLPERDLIVSPQHRMLVRSRIAQRMFGQPEVLAAAKQLLALDGVDVMHECTEIEYFHFMCDRHELVIANGAATESLHTGPEAMKSLPQKSRQEILSIFPDLLDVDYSSIAARMLLSGRQARQLAMRHQRNAKPLLAAVH